MLGTTRRIFYTFLRSFTTLFPNALFSGPLPWRLSITYPIQPPGLYSYRTKAGVLSLRTCPRHHPDFEPKRRQARLQIEMGFLHWINNAPLQRESTTTRLQLGTLHFLSTTDVTTTLHTGWNSTVGVPCFSSFVMHRTQHVKTNK